MKKIIIAQSILDAVGSGGTLFRRGGISVVPASRAEDVLTLHRDQQADLLIIDHHMPVMGGAKLCAAIRADAVLRDVSIILLGERAGPSAAEGQQAGANAILVKPLDLGELFSKVSHLLMVQDRADIRVPLRMSVSAKGATATFVGVSRDISVSGMLLESGRVLQKGERLRCSFTLQARTVEVEGVVVRAEKTPTDAIRYGVQFLSLDAKTFVLLEHLVKNGGKV